MTSSPTRRPCHLFAGHGAAGDRATRRVGGVVASGSERWGSTMEQQEKYATLFRLDGRTAVVVGAGSGIGREAAFALAAHGAQVVAADVRRDAAEETASALGSAGTAYQLDVLDPAAVERVAREHDTADVLVFTPAVN